jgi:UDPglucose 6-dehydrogenase
MKSTVPVGTGERIMADLAGLGATQVTYASNPEFLREGAAIQDFLEPDRIVVGSFRPADGDVVEALYRGIDAEVVRTSVPTAEMIKYASNAFLATRISFINEIANICEHLGANVKEVAIGMGYDRRIGHHFLDAGIGYGGSCFPKDVKALAHMAATHGTHPQLLKSVMDINQYQRMQVIIKLREVLGSQLRGRLVGLLGLAFKPTTDDLRAAPASFFALASSRQ